MARATKQVAIGRFRWKKDEGRRSMFCPRHFKAKMLIEYRAWIWAKTRATGGTGAEAPRRRWGAIGGGGGQVDEDGLRSGCLATGTTSSLRRRKGQARPAPEGLRSGPKASNQKIWLSREAERLIAVAGSRQIEGEIARNERGRVNL